MSLDRRDIENIAQLARLALTESELPRYAENLSRILALVGQLERADTSQVEPMAHPLPGQRQRLRADEVTDPTSTSSTSAMRRRWRRACISCRASSNDRAARTQNVAELSQALHSRTVSSVELTRAFLARIEQHNQALNAFITILREAHWQRRNARMRGCARRAPAR